MKRDYDVGHKKPPIQHRFKPGESGNPGGRPPRITRVDMTIGAALDSRVRVTDDGKSVRIRKREAVALRLFLKALRGDMRAMEILLQFALEKDPEDLAPIIKFAKRRI